MISCVATNRSYNADGQPASTATANWSVRIGEPVRAGITFGHVVEHCRRVVRHVKVPGHWASARRHHKWVRVRKRASVRTEHALSCRAVTPERRVEQLPFGHRVTVSGWLGAERIALSHVPVRVLAALDDGRYHWRTVAVVTTSADGRWRATLRPGPSRLIRAVYDGGPTTLPATSRRARTVVPARVVLDPTPSRVPWGGVLVIRGRVLGWHFKPEQVLQVLTGVGRHLHILGNPSIGRDGRFVIQLAALGSGPPLQTQVAVATLRETNIPYGRGVSERRWVTVG